MVACRRSSRRRVRASPSGRASGPVRYSASTMRSAAASPFYVASRQAEGRTSVRAAHVPSLREARRRTAAAGRWGLFCWPREDRRRVLLHGLVHVADVRDNVVLDLHERRCGVRGALRNRRDARDRLTEIPHDRVARLFRRGIAELRRL